MVKLVNNVTSIEVAKEFTFDSAHKLDKDDGKCAQIHGHTYRLFVYVANEFKDSVCSDGFVINFAELKKIVSEVLQNIDHKFIIENKAENEKFFSEDGVVVMTFKPTAENLGLWLLEMINDKLPKGKRVTKIVLYETPTSFVTITA